MKLSAIKTRQGFYDFADIWYQRAHNLRRIWQSEDTDMIRKFKAFDLWVEMVRRVQLLKDAAILINQYVPKEEFYSHPIIDPECFDEVALFNSMKNGSHAVIKGKGNADE